MKRFILLFSVAFFIASCNKDETAPQKMGEFVSDSVDIEINTSNIGTPALASSAYIKYSFKPGDSMSFYYIPDINSGLVEKRNARGNHYYIKLWSTASQRMRLKVNGVYKDSIDCIVTGSDNSVVLTGNF